MTKFQYNSYDCIRDGESLFDISYIVKLNDVTRQLIINNNLFVHVCLHLF